MISKRTISLIFLMLFSINTIILLDQTQYNKDRNLSITINPDLEDRIETVANISNDEIEHFNSHPRASDIANSPNLASTMFPIIINMADFSTVANALNGKDYTNIRVAYYSADYKWIQVPFQIDEIARPYRWEDHYDPSAFPPEDPNPQLYQFDGYIPFGDPYGKGYDQNPGKIDSNDELVFYAYNGRQVSNYLWLMPDKFSNRIEVHITDPSNGGESWMYIYYTTRNLGDIKDEPWYFDYVSWDPSLYKISTPVYELSFNPSNFDVISQIKIHGTHETNLVNGHRKRFRELELAEPWYARAEGVWPSNDGFANPGSYSTQKTAIDDPSDPYDSDEGALKDAPSINNDITGAGDHRAAVDGPCRVILYNPRFQYSYAGQVMGYPAEYHEQSHVWHKFYYNMMVNYEIGEDIDQPPSIAPDLYIYYSFQTITEINSAVRNDMVIYFGADPSNPSYSQFSGGLKIGYPDGNPNNDGYTSGGDPTSQTAKITPDNPQVADWILITSNNNGGMWQYICRGEQYGQTGLREMNFYWHDGAITEMGLETEYGKVESAGVHIPELEYVSVFGDFRPDQNPYDLGEQFYKIKTSNGLISGTSFTVQTKPSGAIFTHITPSRLYYMGRKETITLDIECDAAGYTLSADFSSVDTQYSDGDETVEDLGGGHYRITYKLSDTNTQSAGTYSIPVTANGHTDSSTYIELFPYDMGQILSTQSTTEVISPPQSGITVTVSVNNPSSVDIEILGINLQFMHDPTGTDVTDDYEIQSEPTNIPYSMPAGTTTPVEFTFTIRAKDTATPELIHVNATMDFIEYQNGYTITRYGADTVDNWTVLDVRPPDLLEAPDDIKIVEGSLGNRISWSYYDYAPNGYNISVAENDPDSNRTVLEYGTWTNDNPIQYSLDNITNGTYYFYIGVNDSFGNIAEDMVQVICTNDPIIINNPPDITYEVGTTGNKIMWQVSYKQDLTPDSYWIEFDGGEHTDYYDWNGAIIIIANVDGLSYGTHTVTCYVNLTTGDFVSDTVNVRILNDQPALINSSGLEYYKGMIHQYIVWEVDDLAQQNSIYRIFLNESTQSDYTNGTWDGMSTISVNVDGLDIGEYYFTVYLDDGLGGVLDGFNDPNGTVKVVVLPNEPPTIMSDGVKTIKQGQENQQLTWVIIDNSYSVYLNNYTIYLDGTPIYFASEHWEDQQIITWEISTDLEVGEYNYTLVVDDGLEGYAENSIILTVEASETENAAGGTNLMVLLGGYIGITVPLSLIYRRMQLNYNPYE